MDDNTWKRIERLFYEAIERAAAEWPAFLDEACGDDVDLRRGVETLLARHTQTGVLFEAPAGWVEEALRELAGSTSADAAVEGRNIGPYRLERELGSGGMGRVFLARREDLPKQVALKLVREPLASPDRVRRFRSEQRILAALEHPHIAQLLDAGVTDDGAPYFAMELVDGEPLPAYCDRRHVNVVQRLRLFLDVCAAVRYAHAHLVVHRDIKPSNVLVTSDGRPKLLDFGVAKLLTRDGEADLTGTRTRVFTPGYASPEQLTGAPVSTATDVYQLGALLYMLLAGRPPLDIEGRSPGEAERIVCEHEPAAPSAAVPRDADSTGFTGPTETAPSAEVAASRSTTAERLRHQLRRDLDNIVLKALEKQPERRYASVEALASDIERFLQGRPVLARGGGHVYRAQKLLRRHRWAIAAAAAFVLILAGYATTASIQAGRVRRALGVAELETEKAEEVSEFLIGLFEAGDPTEQWGVDLTGGELLERGVRRADELSGRPELQARLLEVIGRTYQRLARPLEAQPLLERALALREQLHGADHADVAAGLHDLGVLARTTNDYSAADSLLSRAVDIRRALFGDRHEDVARSLFELGVLAQNRYELDGADSLLTEALAIRRSAIGEHHLDTGTTLNNLGTVLVRKGDYARAEPLLREALAIRSQAVGADHPFVVSDQNNLGWLLLLRGESADAEAHLREALAINARLLGKDHYWNATLLNNLAGALREQGEYAEAESLLRKALALSREKLQRFGQDDADPDVARYLQNLALVHLKRGDPGAAEPLLRESLELRRELFAQGDWRTAGAEGYLGECLAALGRFDEAEPLMIAGFEALLAFWGPDHPHTREARDRLVGFYESRGRPEAAATYRNTAVASMDQPPRGR